VTDGLVGVDLRVPKTGARCHVGVMRIAMNGGNWQQKLKGEGESGFPRFVQNLLIPFDLSRLRQIAIGLVTRLLTEGLDDLIFGQTSVQFKGEINDALPRKRHQKRDLEFCTA
jgi:hypothetical protein